MADPTATPPPAGPRRGRWALAAVAVIAVVGGGAGAYFGLRGAHGPGSGPGDAPSGRAYAAAAYDESRHQVVLFGGTAADGTTLGDTWTWDGSSWTQQHPSVSPPARASAAMSYDPQSHDVLLVAGRDAQKASLLTDTWEWDGFNWHATGQPAPSQLAGPAPSMATDPTTGQVILTTQQVQAAPTPACLHVGPGGPASSPVPFPGCPIIEGPVTLHAWLWSGAEWTMLAAQPRHLASMGSYGAALLVADPESGHLLLVQVGSDASAASAPLTPCCWIAEMTWDGTAWADVHPPLGPVPATTASEIAADTTHRAVVAYATQSTWTRIAGAWKELHPSPSPGLVSGATMVFDGAAGRVLLFGGLTSPQIPELVTPVPVSPPQRNPVYSNALWSWDGTTWTRIAGGAPSPQPSPSPAPTNAVSVASPRALSG